MLRLRRLRGMTQEQLAERIGTRQPAIARLERGHANTTLATIVAAAEALDATVRVDLEPVELLGHEPRPARWWERVTAPTVAWHAVSPEGAPLHVTVMTWQGTAPTEPVGPSVEVAAAQAALSWPVEASPESTQAPAESRLYGDAEFSRMWRQAQFLG